MLLIAKKATKDQMEKMARHFSGYIKVVVDLEKEILVGGADRHVDEEQMLLNNGSKHSESNPKKSGTSFYCQLPKDVTKCPKSDACRKDDEPPVPRALTICQEYEERNAET